MKLDDTLRSKATQQRYQEDIAKGVTGDITEVKGDGMIGGLKILNDRYPPDMCLKDVDNLIGEAGKDWEAFIKFGLLYFNGQLPYDGFWLNNHHKMSQPKAWHIKGCNFKKREDYTL